VALVVHGDVQIEDALAQPADPVLEELGVRAGLRPPADALRTGAVRDRVRADADARPDGVRLEVDLAGDVRDLNAPPLRPRGVAGGRPVRATRGGLEARDRGRVVAPGREVRRQVA